jgi:hypothetical protein
MPVIHKAELAIRDANRRIKMAKLLNIPRLFTAQNAKGFEATIEALYPRGSR